SLLYGLYPCWLDPSPEMLNQTTEHQKARMTIQSFSCMALVDGEKVICLILNIGVVSMTLKLSYMKMGMKVMQHQLVRLQVIGIVQLNYIIIYTEAKWITVLLTLKNTDMIGMDAHIQAFMMTGMRKIKFIYLVIVWADRQFER